MCGRFVLKSSHDEIASQFGLTSAGQLTTGPHYNIAPSTEIAVIRSNETGKRELAGLRWGLIPPWAKDSKRGTFPINARAETCATKPMFRNALRKRRCLIPADGFYEWGTIDGRKQPFYFHMLDDRPFAFAGLWERWKGDGQTIDSCAIIVGTANELLQPIHDRMPIILEPNDYDLWLNPEITDAELLTPLLKPYPADEMAAYPVSTRVNSPRNDYAELIQSIG